MLVVSSLMRIFCSGEDTALGPITAWNPEVPRMLAVSRLLLA